MVCKALCAAALWVLIVPGGDAKSGRAEGALSDIIAREAARLLESEKGLAARIRVASQKAFPGTDAGESVDTLLYADVISLASRAVELDGGNLTAHTVLAEAYFAKSYEGEGSYTTKLVQAAQQEAEFVIRARSPGKDDHIKTAQRILERIRALRPEELLP